MVMHPPALTWRERLLLRALQLLLEWLLGANPAANVDEEAPAQTAGPADWRNQLPHAVRSAIGAAAQGETLFSEVPPGQPASASPSFCSAGGPVPSQPVEQEVFATAGNVSDEKNPSERRGARFHKVRTCPGLNKNRFSEVKPILEAEARQLGLTPCLMCF